MYFQQQQKYLPGQLFQKEEGVNSRRRKKDKSSDSKGIFFFFFFGWYICHRAWIHTWLVFKLIRQLANKHQADLSNCKKGITSYSHLFPFCPFELCSTLFQHGATDTRRDFFKGWPGVIKLTIHNFKPQTHRVKCIQK